MIPVMKCRITMIGDLPILAIQLQEKNFICWKPVAEISRANAVFFF
jgi:hypothetical protein